MWRFVGRAVYWLLWLPGFVYAHFTKRTRVLVCAGDRFLLVQGWIDDGSWSLPGGGLHRHENLVQGAVREVAEETGVVLPAEQCKILASEWRHYRGIRYFCHYLAASLPAPVELRTQRGEIVAAQWFSVEELDGLRLKSDVRRALVLLAGQG